MARFTAQFVAALASPKS